MSEYLTTGQMMDKLEVDEVAEVVEGFLEGTKVKKTDHKEVIYENTSYKGKVMKASYQIMHAKWRILPDYVSFDEAMKAVKENKMVHFHPSETTSINVHNDSHLCWFGRVKWSDMINGKWTVAE